MAPKVYIASDHAGIDLKSQLIASCPSIEWKDLGPNINASVDYPDFADKLCLQLREEPLALGVLICGSGQGMSMRANKFSHIRAALCWNEEIARLSKEHNDANVLCLGARFINVDLAKNIFNSFLNTQFAGGRHSERVRKLSCPAK